MEQAKPTRSWFKISLFSLAGLILAFGLVFAGIQIGRKQTQTKIISTALVTPTPDLTTGWKTYENKWLGFTIKLPPGWVLRGEGGTRTAATEERGLYSVSLGEADFWQEPNEKRTLSFEIYELNNPDHKRGFQENLDTAKSSKTVKIGGKEFKKWEDATIPIAPGKNKTATYWTLEESNNGAKILVGDRFSGADLEESLIIQILSTFKFLDQNQVTATAGWENYSEFFEQFGFTLNFKYPNGWIAERSTHGGHPNLVTLFSPDKNSCVKISVSSEKTTLTIEEVLKNGATNWDSSLADNKIIGSSRLLPFAGGARMRAVEREGKFFRDGAVSLDKDIRFTDNWVYAYLSSCSMVESNEFELIVESINTKTK